MLRYSIQRFKNNNKMKRLNFQTTKIFLQFISLVVFCALSSYALGYRDLWLNTVCTMALLLALIAVPAQKSRLVYGLLALLMITSILYFPIGWMYGAPTHKIIGSFLETDVLEAREFLSTIPQKIYLFQLFYFVFCILLWKFANSFFKSLSISHSSKNLLMILAAVGILAPPALILFPGEEKKPEMLIKLPIIAFYADGISAPFIYVQRKRIITEGIEQPSDWHLLSVKPRYKNYVLVIGESARKDYHHVYGFPLNNTPFLSQTPGLFLDGYVSAGSYTIVSLISTLSQPLNPSNNIITLAKSAGFQTAWLSNQGMTGFFSSDISRLTKHSEYIYYTQRGEYNDFALKDDLLLPVFQRFLQKKSDAPRLLVLHLMGSHTNFCDRVHHKITFDFLSKDLSCYVSSIAQTDEFLRQTVELLKEHHEPFSLIYFSDHGLVHSEKNNLRKVTLINGEEHQQSFDVPFLRIASDDTEHRVLKVQRSAFSFLKGFEQWTGISTQELSHEQCDFFSDVPDTPSSHNNLYHYQRLKSDPIPHETQE